MFLGIVIYLPMELFFLLVFLKFSPVLENENDRFYWIIIDISLN